MRPVELGRLQPGETVEEHKAAVAAVMADVARSRVAITPTLAAAAAMAARAAADLEAQLLAMGQAIAAAMPADPDEPLWFDAMRPDPDAEAWTP